VAASYNNLGAAYQGVGWEKEGLFKAKAVNEVDTERDRATPAQEVRQGAKQETASPASAFT
jgi:hypothetical protein